jgi:aspartate aminotransferase
MATHFDTIASLHTLKKQTKETAGPMSARSSISNTAATRSFARLAKRLEHVGFSDIVKVRNRVLELRASGQTVHAFHGGEPFFPTAEPVKQALVQAAVEDRTKYAPSSGIPALRKAIVEKLKARNHMHEVSVDDVIVTVGGAHALWVSFQAVLDAGDEVLVFSPYWTPIADMVRAAEATPIFVPTGEARREGLSKTLARYATPATRAIYYNTPQNPSGVVFSRSEAQEAADFAQERDLVVIADEAYEDLVYDGEHVSIASLPGMAERTITTYTFSKSYAMTGWRIGYAVAKEPFMTGLKKLVLYSTNGVTTMVQYAGLAAMQTALSELHLRRDEYRQRRDLLVNGLLQLGFKCSMPQGAFYAFPESGRVHPDSREAAALLLDRAHVATIPGVVFGAQGEGHLRFGYATGLEEIAAGLEAIRKAF